jgi:hypothetical protein
MSKYDFNVALNVHRSDLPFDALIMAAALAADTGNLAQLATAFPALAREARRRYDAPGGHLPEDDDVTGHEARR